MKPRLEPRPPLLSEQSFLAFRRVESAFPFDWHFHPEGELTWIEAGEGTRYVGDTVEPYQPGDLVLLGGNLPHTWSSERPARRKGAHRAVVVQFPVTLFEGAAGPEFAAVRDLLSRASRGLHFPAGVTSPETWSELASLRGLAAWCALARLLDRLARVEGARPIASPGYLPAPRHGSRRRFERALAFVAQQAEAGPVYLRDAARVVHLTPAAFSRFFQRFAGETFVRHVNGLRVAKASRLLVETDQSVATIAFACGFGNLANFNRRFRALKGVTPLAWRSRFAAPWSPQGTSPKHKSKAVPRAR
jgi:AraC-like DNA-binding protein